jgi:hypothetical protein
MDFREYDPEYEDDDEEEAYADIQRQKQRKDSMLPPASSEKGHRKSVLFHVTIGSAFLLFGVVVMGLAGKKHWESPRAEQRASATTASNNSNDDPPADVSTSTPGVPFFSSEMISKSGDSWPYPNYLTLSGSPNDGGINHGQHAPAPAPIDSSQHAPPPKARPKEFHIYIHKKTQWAKTSISSN